MVRVQHFVEAASGAIVDAVQFGGFVGFRPEVHILVDKSILFFEFIHKFFEISRVRRKGRVIVQHKV